MDHKHTGTIPGTINRTTHIAAYGFNEARPAYVTGTQVVHHQSGGSFNRMRGDPILIMVDREGMIALMVWMMIHYQADGPSIIYSLVDIGAHGVYYIE